MKSLSDVPEKTARKIIYVLLFAGMLFWGNAFAAIKYLLQYVSAWKLVYFRHIPAAVFSLVIILLKYRRESISIWKEHKYTLILLGLIAVPGYNYLLNKGQTAIPSGTAGLIGSLNPVFTMLVAAAVIREKVTLKKTAGIILSFAGVFILFKYGAGAEISFAYKTGILITSAAPLTWAVYTVAAKTVSQKYDAFFLVCIIIITGTVTSLPFMPLSITGSITVLPLSFWLVLIFLILFCTFVAFIIWMKALKYIEATKVATFVYLIPLFSLIFGKLYFNEPFTEALYVSAVLMLGGVWITQRG